jgi:hypothetical protein
VGDAAIAMTGGGSPTSGGGKVFPSGGLPDVLKHGSCDAPGGLKPASMADGPNNKHPKI